MATPILPILGSDQVTIVLNFLKQFQDNVCHMVLASEPPGADFKRDTWERLEGGGGESRVLEKAHTFDRAGVNFSHVFGKGLPPAATLQRPELKNAPFEAMGVSLVLHPINPYVPTTHANLRLFVARPADLPPVWWFGGGFDLTPYYPFEEDCVFWHQCAQAACAPFGAAVYPDFKKQCDEYFYLPHRHETRGVGGLFFDDLNEWGFERTFAFVENVGAAFIKAYTELLKRRMMLPFTERQRAFQLYRRGRYVEFNLLYDRGTLFGLQSRGRTESILMSLPPEVHWRYDYHAEPNSPESALLNYLKPRDWLF